MHRFEAMCDIGRSSDSHPRMIIQRFPECIDLKPCTTSVGRLIPIQEWLYRDLLNASTWSHVRHQYISWFPSKNDYTEISWMDRFEAMYDIGRSSDYNPRMIIKGFPEHIDLKPYTTSADRLIPIQEWLYIEFLNASIWSHVGHR